MYTLDNTNEKIQVKLGEAISGAGIKISVSYAINSASVFTPSSAELDLTITTITDLVPSPSASQQHLVKYLHLLNKDSIPHTLEVSKLVNATSFELKRISLGANESAELTENGWAVFDASGAIKTVSGNPLLTTNELDAIQNANSPTAANPFATINDINAGSGLVYAQVNRLIDLNK